MILQLNPNLAVTLEVHDEVTRDALLPFRLIDHLGQTHWVFLTPDELRRMCGHLLSLIPKETPRGI